MIGCAGWGRRFVSRRQSAFRADIVSIWRSRRINFA